MSDESKRSQFNRWWSQFGRNNMEPSQAAWIGWLERDRMAEVAAAPEAQAPNWPALHKALEPFAMAALSSRDEWHKQDGAMAELGVPNDADAWMPDGITQGQLNALEQWYEWIERLHMNSGGEKNG